MDNTNIEELVLKVKDGDDSAFSQLFELTQEKAYYTALKITKNSDDAQDMLQDSYIKAFTSLNSLDNPDKFISWFNCIVANKCKDYLIKKKPNLFSQYSNDEDEFDFEDTLKNEDKTLLPQEVTDSNETKKLVMECIDKLPDDQKICVVMYYYDEMGIKEIAQALSVSDGTVKSRLNYARKKLKNQFDDLEKKGTKLHGVPFIPLIRWAFSNDKKSSNIPKLLKKSVAKRVTKELVKQGTMSSGSKIVVASVIGTKATAIIAASAIAIAAVAGTAVYAANAKKDVVKQANSIVTTSVSMLNNDDENALNSEVSCNDLAVLSQDGKSIYYATDNSLCKMDCKSKKSKPVFDGKISSLLIKKNLYFISNNKLYCIDAKTNKVISSHKSDVSCFYSLKSGSVYGLNKQKNICYKINLDNYTEKSLDISGSDMNFNSNYIYYRDSNNNVLRKNLNKLKYAQNVVTYENNKEKMVLPYFVTNNKTYYSDFLSDETGTIKIFDINKRNTKSIKLKKNIVDFCLINNRIIYSVSNLGTFICDSSGDGSKTISKNIYYYTYHSGKYVALFDAKNNKSIVLDTEKSKNILECDSIINSFVIVNNNVFYKTKNGYNISQIDNS